MSSRAEYFDEKSGKFVDVTPLQTVLADELRMAALMTAPPMMTRDAWLRVADECARQMRWVAFQATDSYRSSEGYEDKDDALADSAGFVTVAPRNWSPK